MKKILIYIAATIVFSSCSREEINGSGEGFTTGETVPIELNLQIEPMLMPNIDTKATSQIRTADGNRVIASDRSGAMLLELIEEPEAPTTRATDEMTIANYWVFQFNGTATTSKLVKMTYYNTEYTPGTSANFSLMLGANQRIVVIANTFDADFNNGWALNGTTYQTLLDKSAVVTADPNFPLVQNGGNYYTPMSGTITGDIAVGADTQNIMLKRNVAQITFKVRVGTDLVSCNWTAQLFDVPDVSYWMPHRTDTPFPATITALTHSLENFAPNTTDLTAVYDAISVPVNCRGTVPGKTPQDRNINPPIGATYAKLIGTNGSITYTYTIHLGANFTEDYNLNPNTKYTYLVTLFDDPNNTDSRIEISGSSSTEGIYAGMFGGELVETPAGSGIWQYTKALYLDVTDASNSVWSTVSGDHSLVAGSKTDGKANTWNMNRGASLPATFSAANLCFERNANHSSLRSQTDLGYVWYLPAQDQLMGVWVTHNATNTLQMSSYWSSSEYDSNSGCEVSVYTGNTGKYGKLDTHNVRCVREL